MPASQSANNRISGKHQLDEQRSAILDAAEKLFLEAGIENTRMIDIAQQAGITRVTLYRYFANRDELAVEVHLRFIKNTAQRVQFDPNDHSLEGYRHRAQSMIRNFTALRDQYRYSGMFDQIYMDNPPDSTLTRWTFNKMIMAGFEPPSALAGAPVEPFSEEVKVIMNSVIWFLEKLALRGELTWANKEIPLEEHLQIFEDMITAYFDRLIETRDNQKKAAIRPNP